MPDPDTDALVERIFKDDQVRRALYSHAARFFGRSLNRQRAGLDAHHLVSAVVDRVLKKGNLHKQPNPEAYLMKAITNAGSDARDRDDRYEQIVPRLVNSTDLATPSHETASTDKLATASVLKDAISELPERAKRVARAKLEYPEKNINELAAHLNVSRDTVRRSFEDMRDNGSLRSFAQPEAEPPPTANAPHSEEYP